VVDEDCFISTFARLRRARYMKKIFSTLTLLALVAGGMLVFVSPVRALTSTEGVIEGCTITVNAALLEGCTADCNFDANAKCGICCLLQTLYKITDWIFVILISLAGLFVVIGAMTLLMSAGDSSKVSSGRNYVMYAVIGLIVGLLARAIPAIVRLVVGA